MLKVGLIGCGGMAAFYREIYQNISGVTLSYVVGATIEEASEVATALGVEKYSMHYEDCLNSDVDIVDISTPNHLHKEQFLAAVNAGKHILLQKPIAPNLEDAAEILRAAESTRCKTGVFMSKRCIAAHHEIKNMVKQGVIGRIASVHTRAALIRKPQAVGTGSWRSSLAQTGGGALIQLGIHDYDLLQWILDDKIKEIAAFKENLMSPHIGGEDMAQTIVRFRKGVLGIVEASYCSATPFLRIYGNEGMITYQNGELSVRGSKAYTGSHIVYETPGVEAVFEMPANHKDLYQINNPYEQHVWFIDAVKKDEKVPVEIADGFETLLLVNAAYESDCTGKAVDVEAWRRKYGLCGM